MAASRIKGITIEINGDSTKLTSALSSVNKAISNTQSNLRDLDKALQLDPGNTSLLRDKQEELGKEIDNVKSKIDTEKQALDQMKNTEGFDANSKAARDLQTQIDLDEASLKQLEKEAKDFGSVGKQQFKAVCDQVQEVGNKLKDVGDKISSVGKDMSARVTAPIVAAFGGSVKAAIDWESAFTGVMKTVDETANTTYDDLKAGINELAKTTASSQNEIAAVMEIAGQLGVSADDITDFTETVIKLKDTTNMTADAAASDIAKFANVTKMSLDDIDKFGAAIVDLGNNYATTEADIMSMATRLAGAGSQVGLSQGEILGLATALSSVGIEAEMGGSAFSKAMIKMQVAVETGFDQVNEVTERAGMSLRDLELMSTNDTKSFKELAQSLGMTTTEIKEVITNGNNLNNFAEVAGTSTEDFVKLYRDDAPAALQAFIVGLGDTESKGESTIAMLQDMGFTEVRLRDTLTRLANSQGLVTDAMTQGNEAWSENAALDAEAEKRYATMESQLSQLKARFTEVAVSIGEILMPYVSQLMNFIQGLIDKWNGLDESQQKMIITIAAIAAAVGPLLVMLGSVVGAIGTIVTVMAGPLGIILAIIAAVTALGVAIALNWDSIKEWAHNVADTVSTKWNEVKTNVSEAFDNMKENVSKRWDEIKEKIQNSKVAEVVKETWQAAKDTMQEKLDNMKQAYDAHGGGLEGAVYGAMEGVKGYYTAGFTFIDKLTGGKLGDMLSTVKTKMLSIKDDIGAKFATIKDDTKKKIEDMKTNIDNTFSNIKNGISQKVTGIKDSIVNGFKNAVDYIKDLPRQAWNWGADMISGIIDGIKAKIGGIADAVSGIANTISSYIHFSEPDVGPLKNFHTFMPDMIKEMISGINHGIPSLENAMSNMSSKLVPAQMLNNTPNGGNNISNSVTIPITVNAGSMDANELANKLTSVISNKINAQIYSKGAAWA